MKSLTLAFQLIGLATFFFVGSLVYLILYNDVFRVELDLIAYSVMDFALSMIVIFVIIRVYRSQAVTTFNSIYIYRKRFNKYIVLVFVSLVYIIHLFYRNIMLVIITQYNREALVQLNSSPLEYILSASYYILIPFAFLYPFKRRFRVIVLTGATLLMAYQFSRSPIIFMGLTSVILVKLTDRKIRLRTTLIALTLITIIVGLTTVLQGRSENIIEGLSNSTEALFRYRAYSFYLAQFSIELPPDIDKVFFSLFGWFSERILTVFIDIDNPISTNGSEFVYRFHFAQNFRANVVYPWWSFFYGSLGIPGLFLKALFIWIMLRVALIFRLPFTLLYLMYVCLFYQYARHPFLNAASCYSFIALVSLDLSLKYKYVKNRSRRSYI